MVSRRNSFNQEFLLQSFRERLQKLSPEKRELFEQAAGVSQKGVDVIAAALRRRGVSTVYGVAGKPTDVLLPACQSKGLRPIGVYHQTSAICMALAHNYQAGRPEAVALVSAGPAVTNSITGLSIAYDNGWPVIVLAGKRDLFQLADHRRLVREVTKHAFSVDSTNGIVPAIDEASEIIMSGRPGPVYVEFHEDVLEASTLALDLREASSTDFSGDIDRLEPEVIEDLASALISGSRPALILGKGVRWTVDPDELQKLVETLSLPFISSPMGRGFISDDHPLCFNLARNKLQSAADVVLILGARLNWVFRHGAHFCPRARVIRADIHHNDRDNSSREVDFLNADAGDLVTRLLQVIRGRDSELLQAKRQEALSSWLHQLRMQVDRTKRWQESVVNGDSIPMSPYRAMKEIRDALPKDAICIVEGNISMCVAQAIIPTYHPAGRMDAGTNACMGVGVPFAIGAKLARPNQPVVAIVGDYGFSLVAAEIEACVRHHIPIVVIVVNNQGNNGRWKQETLFPDDVSENVIGFQSGLQYDAIMRTFGGRGLTLSNPRLLKAAVEDAITSGVPSCINVVTDPSFPLPNAWGEQPQKSELPR